MMMIITFVTNNNQTYDSYATTRNNQIQKPDMHIAIKYGFILNNNPISLSTTYVCTKLIYDDVKMVFYDWTSKSK